MAGLVDKVKQSIRSRSRNRKSGSQASVRASGEFNRASLDHERYMNQSEDEHFSRSPVSQNAPAGHVRSGGSNQFNKPLPSEPISNGSPTTTRTDNESGLTRQESIARKPVAAAVTDAVPARSSSLRQNEQYASLRQNERHSSPRQNEEYSSNGNTNYRGAEYGEHPAHSTHPMHTSNTRSPQENLRLDSNGNRNEESLADTMNSLNFDNEGHVTVHNPNHTGQNTRSATNRGTTGTEAISEHVRLPEGFHTGHKESTHVTTDVREAVTQEKVHIERTEIIQEAITRDIHVHHYFTYLQPVKVVEVLPARHYTYDPATGRKTEIQAPAGWTMPDNMREYTPDTSMITSSTRHYMVDEQHPHGIPEAPPLRHKEHHEQLQQSNSRVGRAV